MLEFLTAHLPEKFFLDTSAFIKNRKGFTLVELVVVIAIIGILAGIAVPRFLDATASARGAKIVADMRTIQSAEMIYYAKNAKYPTNQTEFADLVQGNWPGVPTGKFIIAQVLKQGGGTTEGVAGDGATYKYAAGADGGSGTITLDGVTSIKGVTGSNYTLTALLGGDQQATEKPSNP
jgi:type II secretion system protein G